LFIALGRAFLRRSLDTLARFQGPQSAPIEGEHELFGFLTTEANAIVAPIHPKAMPVILTTAADLDIWLDANTSDALALSGRCRTTRYTLGEGRERGRPCSHHPTSWIDLMGWVREFLSMSRRAAAADKGTA